MRSAEILKKVVVFSLFLAVFALPSSFSEDKNDALKGKLRKLEESILDEVKETAKLLEEKNEIISQLQIKLKDSFQREEELTSQFNQANEEIYLLRKDIKYLNGLTESKENELQKITEKVQELEEENKIILQLQEKLKTASQKEVELSNEVGKSSKEIYQLHQDVSYFKKEAQDRAASVKEMEDKILQLEDENKVIARLQQKVKTISEERGKVSADLEIANSEISNLYKDMGYLKKDTEVKVQEINELKGKLALFKEDAKRIFELEERVGAFEQNEKNLTSKLERADKQIYKLNEDKNYLNKEIKSKEGSLKEAKEQLFAVKEENKRIFELEEKVKTLIAKEEELTSDNGEVNKQVYKLTKEIDFLKKKVVDKDKEIKEAAAREEQLREENKLIFQLQEKIKAQNTVEEELTANLAGADKKISRLYYDIDCFKKEIGKTENELKVTEKQRRVLKDENKQIFKLQEKLKSASDKELDLVSRLDGANKKIYQLEKDISYLKKEGVHKGIDISDARKKIKFLEDENKRIFELQEKLDGANQREKELAKDLTRSQKEMSRLKADMSTLSTEIGIKDRQLQGAGELKAMLEEKNKLIFEMDEKLKYVSDGEQQVLVRLHGADKEIYDLNARIDSLTKKLEDKDKEIEEVRIREQELGEENKVIAALKEKLQIVGQKEDNTKVKLLSANKEITRLSKEIDSFKKELKVRDTKIEMAEEQARTLGEENKIIFALRERIKAFEDKDKESSGSLNKASSDITQLRKEISSLNQELAAKNAEIERAQEQARTLGEENKVIFALRERIQAFEDKEKEAANSLNIASSDNQQLRKEISSLNQELAAKNAGIKRAEEQARTLGEENKVIFALRERIKAFEDKEKEAANSLNIASRDNQQLRKEIGSLNQKLVAKDAAIKKVEEQARALGKENKVIYALREQIKSFENQEKETLERLSNADNEIKHLMRQIHSFNKELAAKNAEIERTEKSAQVLREDVKEVFALNAKLKSSERETEKFRSQLEQADKKIAQLSEEMVGFEDKVIVQSKEISESNEKLRLLNEKDKVIRRLEAKLDDISREENNLILARKEDREKIRNLTSQMSSLKENLKNKEADILELEIRAEGAVDEKEIAKEVVSRKDDKIKDLSSEIRSRESEIEALETKLVKKDQINKDRIKDVYKEIDERDKEIEYLKSVIGETISKIKLLSGSKAPTSSYVATK
jgi:chromosome segregation ATPase